MKKSEIKQYENEFYYGESVPIMQKKNFFSEFSMFFSSSSGAKWYMERTHDWVLLFLPWLQLKIQDNVTLSLIVYMFNLSLSMYYFVTDDDVKIHIENSGKKSTLLYIRHGLSIIKILFMSCLLPERWRSRIKYNYATSYETHSRRGVSGKRGYYERSNKPQEIGIIFYNL